MVLLSAVEPPTYCLRISCSSLIGKRFRCIYGLRTQPTDSRLTNRFSCNGTFPVGPWRFVVTRTASSERKLTLVDAISEFDASDCNDHAALGHHRNEISVAQAIG